MLQILLYILASVFFIVGGLFLESAFRKPSTKQIIDGKISSSSGRVFRTWLVYIGIVLIGIAVVILFDIKI